MWAVSAQTYPTKPVKLMVGAGAGGGTDIIARMLAEKMTDALKGTFIVEINPVHRTRLLLNSLRRHHQMGIRYWLQLTLAKQSHRIYSSSILIP